MILSELKIVGQKECGPTEKLLPTKFGYKKILDKKDLVNIFWVQKKFGSREVRSKTDFG